MMHMHGEQYGDGVPWAEEGQGSVFFLMDGNIPVSIMKGAPYTPIVVFVKVVLINLIICHISIFLFSGTMLMVLMKHSQKMMRNGLLGSEKLPVKRK